MTATGGYYGQANPDLICRIPVTADTVLEIGCGSGALGRAYKRINPNATYIGIEIMPGPAAHASSYLDYVLEADINDTAKNKLPEGISKVDCLVFGDVLEHLIDPAETIRALLLSKR